MLKPLVLALLLAPSLLAQLPDYLTLPKGVAPPNADSLTVEEFGEAVFPVSDGGEPLVQRGRHWSAALVFEGLGEETDDNDIWARVKPALVKGGWTIVKEFDANPYSATFRHQKGGRDAWGHLMLFSTRDLRLEVVELRPQAVKLTLTPPGPTLEKVSAEAGDFPYLSPIPGSTRAGSGPEGALVVPAEGSREAQVMAASSIQKAYRKDGLSNVQLTTIYRDALKTAGWDIVHVSQGVGQSDAVLIAHYGKSGRNVWAYLHGSGGEYTIQVGDAGSLAAELAKSCRAPLYGVFFDFDKSTLKPESDAVLATAADALRASPKLAVEVEGHTDNVGKDEYNLKLSGARAEAVVTWLVAHGIEPSRLGAKGYGRSKPVTSNDTDEGRARNRRVELACRK